MKAIECEFESAVLAAVLQSRWPERVDSQLIAHASTCVICSDVAAIASAMEDACGEMRERGVIPNSGRVWWIAQMRARREATEAAGRPLTAAQVIAFACAVGLLGACFGATSRWFQSALGRIASSVSGIRIQALLPSATALVAGHGALILAMAAMLILVPAAVYLAMSKE